MLGDVVVDDSQDIGEIVQQFQAYIKELARDPKEAEEMDEPETQLSQKAFADMLITSGFSFEGYSITKYSGYISGDDVVSISRDLWGYGLESEDPGTKIMESLVHVRRNALKELKEAAYALGCNAVIGVDFDYLTIDPQKGDNLGIGEAHQFLDYIFGVTANGNAVVIEKK